MCVEKVLVRAAMGQRTEGDSELDMEALSQGVLRQVLLSFFCSPFQTPKALW